MARELKLEGFKSHQITFERYVNLRYSGSDTMIMILEPEDGDYSSAFIKEHQREFSSTLPNRKVLVENLRVRGRANAGIQSIKKRAISSEMSLLPSTAITSNVHKTLRVYFEGGWTDAPLHLLKDCTPGDTLQGPAMIYDQTQMIVVQPGATAKILQSHVVINLASKESSQPALLNDSEPLSEDPIQLSVMSNRFMGIAEQMGLTLQKTSVSVNIKERLDFSCALFGVSSSIYRGESIANFSQPDGGLVANAPHVPVHLGSMEHAVRFQHNLHSKNLRPGDVLVSNT